MRTLILAVAVAACGVPAPEAISEPEAITASSCAGSRDDAIAYPLTVDFDGSKGRDAFAQRVPAAHGWIVTALVKNEPGNHEWNMTRLRVAVNACDGRALGAFTQFEVLAADRPGEWQLFAAPLDLSLFPEAATVDLFVLPLWARGQHRVQVVDLRVDPNN
jgi:hypothetical protein